MTDKTVEYYYVDKQQKSQGPINFDELKSLYKTGNIDDNSFVWNGTTIKEWTNLGKCNTILKLLKPKPHIKSNPRPTHKTRLLYIVFIMYIIPMFVGANI